MEQERLAKAFGVDLSKVEEEENLDLLLAQKALQGREETDISSQLEEIREAIDDGKKGVARGKIESLKKWLAQNNLYPTAQNLSTLNEYSSMVE